MAGATGFDWDDGNRKKCQKHGLSISEVEYILAHSETFIVPSLRNSDYEPRFIAVGRAPGGRLALVVFTPRQAEGRAV
jgi:uncharacterized DUF497 family protein